MSNMADALSAGGLLLAAVALVYSAWSPQIDAAIEKSMGTTDGEISRSREEIRAVRNQRAAPLLIAALLILAAFLRRDIAIICSTKCAGQRGCIYDDIATVFLLTQVLVGAFAIYLFGRIRELNRKL